MTRWHRCVNCGNYFPIVGLCPYDGGPLMATNRDLGTIIMEDRFREKNGWRGEMALFRAANEQHKKTHPVVVIECEICMAITRNMARLLDESKEMIGGREIKKPDLDFSS